MKTRNSVYILSVILSVLLIGSTLVSCEDYLDKAPEATITEQEVFGNFVSFQGFVEEMYNCLIDYNKCGWWSTWLWSDEVLNNRPEDFDNGDYWNQGAVLYGNSPSIGNSPISKRVWPLCWYGIRKANISLSKLDLMIDATQEEKDLIKGQALFFRGFFHFELMRYWGGLPYIDEVLSSSEKLEIPRLNYRETALRAAKDLEEAATLLPLKWDDTQAGQATLGDNSLRISKVAALAFLGKNLLYAASPMMNEESTGSASYDIELSKEAAKVLADVIKLCDDTGAYRLLSWDNWTDNFWIDSPGNQIMPGGTEVIMQTLPYDFSAVRWSSVIRFTPVEMGGNNGWVEVPTHNFTKNYRMTNGLPIDDPLSGFDPNNPWTNREPRFYKDIIIDGDELVKSESAGPDQFAQLYNNGRHKGGSTGSTTGYYYKRWSPIGTNKWDNRWSNFQMYPPYMRLADVYLLYAEAALQGYGTPSGAVPGSITAVQSLNIIRNRAQLPNLDSKFTSTKNDFMEAVIRERAIELAFDTNRFHDLRRWNLAGQTKYKEKTAIDFDRGPNGEPINIRERVVVTRVFDKKHNWLPFQVNFTKLYKDFPQNPGW